MFGLCVYISRQSIMAKIISKILFYYGFYIYISHVVSLIALFKTNANSVGCKEGGGGLLFYCIFLLENTVDNYM